MDELPDVGEIQEMVAAVEAKRADVTSAQQFDIDHQVLLNVRGEIAEMLARELPAEYDKDDLRALLERIENAITRNRTQRAEATRSAEAIGSSRTLPCNIANILSRTLTNCHRSITEPPGLRRTMGGVPWDPSGCGCWESSWY